MNRILTNLPRAQWLLPVNTNESVAMQVRANGQREEKNGRIAG
jgi:hypothetical protein